MCVPTTSFPAFEISPVFPTLHFCYSAYCEESGREHGLGFLRVWAAQRAAALSFRSLPRSSSRKRFGLWIKMMMMQGRRVSPIIGCLILQISCDCCACITSVTASDYENELLQTGKCWNWDCRIAVVTLFIHDCQNTLLVSPCVSLCFCFRTCASFWECS